jgi:RHS repeat-associated protein
MRPAVRWNVVLAGVALGAALLGAGGAQAQSAGTRIAGPFTVTLPSAQTFSFSTGFKVPTPIQGSYIVRVQLSAANSLTVASLKLNGVQIFSLADFGGGVTSVDKVVTLLASDTIALTVAGITGTKTTITVFTVAMPKPVSLAPDPLPLNIGGSGTLTATLSPTPTASGTLTVANSNASVASVPASVAFAPGQTSVAIPVSALSGGSATIAASANGGQASATVAVDTPPSVNLSSPAANSVFQAGATILLNANAADPDGTVARVDFYQGGTLIGSATTVPYSFSWANVVPGSYSLTAVATDNQGSSTASAAVTIRVNAPPAVSLTSPATGTTFAAPATIPLAATASDSDGTIARVDFYQGTTPIGAVTSAPYTFSWTNVTQGSYALTAVATDNHGAVTTSAVVSVTVNSGAAQMFYIVPDHLNTPRLVSDQAQRVVWRWDNTEPFGNSMPNDDPDGDGVPFVFDLRFPGQFFDRETVLAYNYLRDYDPAIGRYVQSDLIGLRAGPNTYLYTLGSPLDGTDPTGLLKCFYDPPNFDSRGCIWLGNTTPKDTEIFKEEPTGEDWLDRFRIPDYRPKVKGKKPDPKLPYGGLPLKPDLTLVGFFVFEIWYQEFTKLRAIESKYQEKWYCPGPAACGSSDRTVIVNVTCDSDWTPVRKRFSYSIRKYYETVQ